MKKYVKKLLSILTALALLVSVMLPAGVIPAFAAETDADDPTVTEIAFTANSAWCDAVYVESAQSATNPYVVKFDYYLPYGQTVTFDSVAGNISRLAGSDELTLKPGHHTFELYVYTTRTDHTFAPRLTSSGATTLYMWNYSCTLNGTDITGNSGDGYTTATATKGGALSTYSSWYATMDSPFVTEIDFADATADATKAWRISGGMYSGGISEETAYTVSFDYYLPAAVNSLKLSSQSGWEKFFEGSSTLDSTAGLHTYTAKLYIDPNATNLTNNPGQFATQIVSDTDATMYMWNFKVEQNNMEAAKSGDKLSSTATVTEGKQLYEYPWYVVLPTEGDVVAYVNSAGTNTESYLTKADYPFKTINDAIKALDAVEGDAINRVIKLVGTYDATTLAVDKNNSSLGFATHTNLITIDGVADEANPPLLNLANFCTIGGPLKLDNLGLGFLKNDNELRLNGNELVIGSGVTLTTAFRTSTSYTGGGRIITGGYHSTLTSGTTSSDAALAHNATVSGGYFEQLTLGYSNVPNSSTYYIDGANLVINGGTVKTLNIGSVGWNTQGKGVFQKNVNVVINGGTISKIISGAKGTATGNLYMHSYTNGAVLQIVLNNDVSVPTMTFADATATTVDGTSVGESVYLLKVASHENGGVTLTTTDATGVYKIVGNIGNYIPVVTDASGNEVGVYDAEAGTVKIDAAGTYTVAWEVAPIRGDAIAYVKQGATTTGEVYGSNDGEVDAADANCYPTISAAITALDGTKCTGNRIIKVIGSYYIGKVADGGTGEKAGTWGGFSTHTNHITIEGYDPSDETALVDLSGLCWVGGPTTFDNIHYNMRTNNTQIRLNGANAVFGSNAIAHFGDSGYYQYYLTTGRYAPGASGNTSPALPVGKQTVEINGQTVYGVIVGDAEPRTAGQVHPTAVDFVMNGGNIVRSLSIGSSYSSGTQYSNFTGDINVTINGGTIGTATSNGNIAVDSYATFASGVKVQIILNNGVLPNGTLPTSIRDQGGAEALYLLKVEKHANGLKLATTDTAGVYTVVGELGEYAPVVYDAEGNEVAGAYSVSTKQITLDEAGTYTVEWEGPSLDIVTNPTKTEYRINDALDLSGLSVTFTPAGGTAQTLTAADYTVTGFSSTTVGTKTLTVTYNGYTATFDVTVVDPTVTTIQFNDSTTATKYYFGHFSSSDYSTDTPYVVTFEYYLPVATTFTWENVGSSGMPQTGNYTFEPGHHTISFTADSTRSDTHLYLCLENATKVTELYIWDITVTCNGVTLSDEGGYNPTVVSSDSSKTLSTYGWYPVMDDSIEVTTKPYKTEYWLGEALNTEGLTLKYTYKNGSTKTVTDGFTVTGYDAATAGTQTLTVTYATYLTTTFEVTVKDPEVSAYHFDFDNEGVDTSFIDSASNFVNKNLFYASSFSTGASTGIFEYSFDYYMPEQSPIYVSHANNTGTIMKDDTTGTGYLQQGRHTYTCTFDVANYSSGSNTILGFATYYNPYADDEDDVRDGAYNGTSLLPGDLYVWNVKLTNTTTGTVRKSSYSDTYSGLGANYVTSGVELNENEMVNKTDVYEIDFTTNDASTYDEPFAYMHLKQQIAALSGNETNEYVISFDYFLPSNNALVRAFFDGNSDGFANVDGSNGLRNIAEGENNDYLFDPGRHTFKAVVTRDMFSKTSTADIYLRFECNYGIGSSLSKLYVWNVQFYCVSGSDIAKGNLVAGMPPVPSGATTAAFTSVPTADLTSVVELEMDSAQFRADYSLRFVAAIKGADITRQDNGVADYTNATITIGGVTYTVKSAGVLFGRDKRIATLGGAPDALLTLGKVDNSNIYDIPAVKLQSEEYHATYLGEGVDGVVYTGVIKNIPRANWEESLSARAYVTIEDLDGNEVTIYGNVISRSLMQVKPSTELSSEYTDEMAAKMKTNVLDAASKTFTGTTYYVDSVNGNDANNGTSDTTAWKTLTNVNALSAGTSSAPVVVLFKRGGEYRGQLQAKSYTSYGAYGTGEKPILNGSQMNYAALPVYEYGEDASAETGLYWQQLAPAFGNRWQLVGMGDYLTGLDSSDQKVGNNVGNMFFFDEYGEMITYGSKSMSASIYQDYEFYHHYDERTFYPDDTIAVDSDNNSLAGDVWTMTLGDLFVYLPEGKTPADFGKIEIASKMSIIIGAEEGVDNINIDNLTVKYAGVHGISFTGKLDSNPVSDVSITNCEIGWIGGSLMRYANGTTGDYTDDIDVRLGNGIEFYGHTDGAVVTNNWIYQCFDAGYSNQGTSEFAQNISVTENLIEYCAYSIEIWANAERGLIEDCHYDNNLMRFAGYEFERDNRIGGALTAISHVNFMSGVKPCNNVTVSGNTFDTSYVSMIVMGYPNSTEKNTANDDVSLGITATLAGVDSISATSDVTGPTVSGNTWIQGYDLNSRLAYLWRSKGVSDENEYIPATSQSEMEDGVARIDPEAVRVIFDK